MFVNHESERYPSGTAVTIQEAWEPSALSSSSRPELLPRLSGSRGQPRESRVALWLWGVSTFHRRRLESGEEKAEWKIGYVGGIGYLITFRYLDLRYVGMLALICPFALGHANIRGDLLLILERRKLRLKGIQLVPQWLVNSRAGI